MNSEEKRATDSDSVEFEQNDQPEANNLQHYLNDQQLACDNAILMSPNDEYDDDDGDDTAKISAA